MKKIKYFIASVAQLYFAIACAGSNAFIVGGESFHILLDPPNVTVKKNNEVASVFKAENDESDSIIVGDYNFDGYPDIAILRDSGIEKYFDVYLFSFKSKKYLKNEFLSGLACPVADQKQKTVVAYCNHASACETWSDTYKYASGILVLIRRDGYNCDPSSGQSFKYYEVYKNGKMISQKSTPITGDK